jgi:hypothetical protein
MQKLEWTSPTNGAHSVATVCLRAISHGVLSFLIVVCWSGSPPFVGAIYDIKRRGMHVKAAGAEETLGTTHFRSRRCWFDWWLPSEELWRTSLCQRTAADCRTSDSSTTSQNCRRRRKTTAHLSVEKSLRDGWILCCASELHFFGAGANELKNARAGHERWSVLLMFCTIADEHNYHVLL